MREIYGFLRLASRLADPLGHPSQVRTQELALTSCVDLRVRRPELKISTDACVTSRLLKRASKFLPNLEINACPVFSLQFAIPSTSFLVTYNNKRSISNVRHKGLVSLAPFKWWAQFLLLNTLCLIVQASFTIIFININMRDIGTVQWILLSLFLAH